MHIRCLEWAFSDETGGNHLKCSVLRLRAQNGRKPSPGRNLLYNGIFGKSLRRSMPAQDVHLRGLSLLLRLGFVVSLEILELCDSRKRATTVHTSQYHHMPELTHVDSLPPSMHLACMSPLQSATSSSTQLVDVHAVFNSYTATITGTVNIAAVREACEHVLWSLV